MTRARSFLVYGFAISVAVHALTLPFVRPERTVAAREVPPDVIIRDRIPTPPPTPQPTPIPKATPQPTQPPHEKPQPPAPQRPPLRVRAFHQTAPRHGGPAEPGNAHPKGDPNGVPDGAGTAAPVDSPAPDVTAALAPAATPRPTPTPLTCARPDVPATTVHALEPDTPALAQQQGIAGTVNVVVSLDVRSRVVAARVQSSPSAVLNGAALAAARGSQFKTEVKNCEPIAADYVFSVDFTAQ